VEYGENNVAADRISKELAESIPLPPFTVEFQKVKFLLNQKAIIKNIRKVPLNHELMESIERDGILSPILTMPSYYPIAGSQRIRALLELVQTHPEGYTFKDIKIEVHKFDKDWWNLLFLWSDRKEAERVCAIWFQMAELVWKSKYYTEITDSAGVEMTHFETLGDMLKWQHNSPRTATIAKDDS